MSSSPVSVEELFAQSAWLRRLAATLVAGESAAEDLVQETWLVALRNPPHGGRSPRPWLARIARNLAANFRRAEARRKQHEAQARPPGRALDPAALAGEIDAQRVLAEAVLRLDEPLRSTIVLRYVRGLDSRAIGRLQGIPDGTVRWRLMRALELLREDLDRRCGGDRSAWCAAFLPLISQRFETSAGGAGTGQLGGALVSAATKIGIALSLAAGLLAAWILLEPEPESERAPYAAVAQAEALPPPVAPEVARLDGAVASREALARAQAPPGDPQVAEGCVVGRVLDPQGRGLAGAVVVARLPPQFDGAFLRREVEDAPVEPRTTSGPDGAYSLALPGVRPFVLSAEHPGLAPVACWPVFPGERRDLVLSAGSTLTVEVYRGSAEGRTPCAGAEVCVRVESPEETGELWAHSVTTDARGSATFPGLPPGEALVEARSQSRLGQRTVASEGAAPVRCEIELLATGRIDGRVVGRETGLPIIGARVEVEGLVEIDTDAHGRFTLLGLPLGDEWIRLDARAAGHASQFERLKLTSEQPERTLDLALDDTLRVSGHVVDDAGRPLAGARVGFVGLVPVGPIIAAYDRVGCETDAGGRFTAELRASTAYRVLARAPGQGLGLFVCGPFPAGSAPLDVGELVLARAASLAGSITDVPVPEKPCFVRLRWMSDEPSSKLPEQLAHVETARADSQRRFAFEDLAPGRYRLELVQPEASQYVGYHGAPAEAVVELGPGEARRDVELGAVPFVEGTVLGAPGRRLPMCSVKVFALAAPERVVASADTDLTGRFRLHPHADGPFRVLVEDPRLLFESSSVEPVELGDVLELELAEFRSPHAIRGVLIPENGEIPKNLYVSFSDSRTGLRIVRVANPEPDGNFTMANLREGPYDLELFDFENRFEPVRVAGVLPGGESVELRLVPRR